MDRLFNPQSIAVIGVSDNPDNLGRIIVGNLLRFGYPGKLTLIGRHPGSCEGLPVVTIDDLPEGIDLAVILTPAAAVPIYLEACGKQKSAYVILEAGGFAEFSETGLRIQQECLAIARHYGMRLVGPNCIGISNPSHGVLTNFVATQKDEILPGHIAMLAQSGGVIMTCGDILAGSGLGLSKTVSMGNKIDLQEAEYLDYFLKDPDTHAIFIYLESVGDGRRLIELARGSEKPIMVYKSNTSPASAAVAASHTAALANDEQVLDAAFNQAGILRLRSLRELVACCKGFSLPPLRGNRLAVFTRSGGYGIVAADLASEMGFDLPPFSPAVLEAVRPYFRVNIMQENNPLDLGTVFDFDAYVVILESCIKEMRPDGLMLIFNYRRQDTLKARQIAKDLANLSRSYQIPVALVFFTETEELQSLEKSLGFPVFGEVFEAMQGLAAWRTVIDQRGIKPKEIPNPPTPKQLHKAKSILTTCMTENRQPYLHEALEICISYGLPVVPWLFTKSRRGVLKLAENLGFPVALKIVSGTISHKTDEGGVILNIPDSTGLEKALEEMEIHLAGQSDGYMLQKMLPPGREVILGGKRDPSFGPVVLVGLGGIYVEVLRDTSLRLAPITLQEAVQMISELRGRKLLEGVRGQPPVDLNLLADCLVRISYLIIDLPEIQDIDINPLLFFAGGGAIVDTRIGIHKQGQKLV